MAVTEELQPLSGPPLKGGSEADTLRIGLSELAHVIGCADILGCLIAGDGTGAIDSVAGSGGLFTPEASVGPCLLYESGFGRPVDIVAIAGVFGEPVTDAVEVVQWQHGIYQIPHKGVLSVFGSGPDGAGVIVNACRRPILEVGSGLDDMHSLIGELCLKGIDGSDQRLQHLLARAGGSGCIVGVPEGIITESDDIEVHPAVDEFAVEIVVIAGVARSVGMDDDLSVRTFLPHGIAAGTQ